MATPTTIKQIDQLNTKFYQSIGDTIPTSHLAVSNTWETWNSFLDIVKKIQPLSAVDIGCGNGRWFDFLLKHSVVFSNALGLDTDARLLEDAKSTFRDHKEFTFTQGNIFDQSLISSLARYTVVTAFGVWHHIPTYSLRVSLLKQLISQNNGTVIISFWQFHKSDRLLKRCVKPADVADSLGLGDHTFEENDYFVGWHGNKDVLRFCHSFSDEEIEQLRKDIGVASRLYYGLGNDATNCYLVWYDTNL